jgi:hypothetical protein
MYSPQETRIYYIIFVNFHVQKICGIVRSNKGSAEMEKIETQILSLSEIVKAAEETARKAGEIALQGEQEKINRINRTKSDVAELEVQERRKAQLISVVHETLRDTEMPEAKKLYRILTLEEILGDPTGDPQTLYESFVQKHTAFEAVLNGDKPFIMEGDLFMPLEDPVEGKGPIVVSISVNDSPMIYTGPPKTNSKARYEVRATHPRVGSLGYVPHEYTIADTAESANKATYTDIAVGEEAILAFAKTRLTYELKTFEEFFEDTEHSAWPVTNFANFLLASSRAEDTALYDKLRTLPGADEYIAAFRDYKLYGDTKRLERFEQELHFHYGFSGNGELQSEVIVNKLKQEINDVNNSLAPLADVFSIDVQSSIAKRVHLLKAKLNTEKARVIAPFDTLEKALTELKTRPQK